MVSFSVVLGFLLTPLKCSPDTLKFSPMRKSFRVPIKVFSRHIKVFARLFPLKFRSSLFKGLRVQRAEPLSRSAEREIFFYGVFFLIAFSFAPAYAKEKAGIDTYAKHVCRRRRDRVSGREFSLCADGTMRKTFIVAVSPPNRLAVHSGKIRKDVAKNADLC